MEVKDVQKTEYLDKNGLDMLWAKVKENTNNQVEVERNRAVEQEAIIIETKADKSEFSNYVPYATFTALEKKVSANTAAISNKQNAGNYLHYETLNNEGYYEISSVCIPGSGGSTKTNIDSQSISINDDVASCTTITSDSIVNRNNDSGNFNFTLDRDGLKLEGGDDFSVLTSNGSTIDITQYALKSELPTVPTKVSQLTNDSKFITINDVDFTPYAKAIDLTNEISRAKGEESTIKETLNTKYDAQTIPVASKEQFGIAKIGDGLNVAAGVISIAPDYLVDMMSYGVEWDVTVADPTCTRIGNPLFHKSLPIQSEYKGCVVNNGKLQYYLNPNDWSKKSNGEPSHLDGTDGDVMIHTPKFYGKSGSNGNKRWVRISTVKVDASWVEIPEMFISAYRITTFVDSDKAKIASVVNTTEGYRGGGDRADFDQYLSTDKFRTDLGKPRSGISRAQARTMANNSGQELLCYEFYKWIFYWNYVIEYANFNSQKEFNSELTSDGYHQGGLGPGLTTWDWNQWNTYNGNYAITPCGYTNEFGNFSGVKAIQLQSPEKTLYANRWRGFENPFGDIWTNLEGIIIKRDTVKANSNVYTTTDVSKYGDDYSLFDIAGIEIAQDGYIGTFDLGSKAEIIPSSITGSESTYKCDYHWCNVDLVEKRTFLVGGGAHSGGWAGLGSFDSDYGVGFACADVGFRSLVRV